MASRLIHYNIGNQILKGKAIERNLFILGNLAPDAQDGTSTGKLCSYKGLNELIDNLFEDFDRKHNDTDLKIFSKQRG